MAKKESIQHKIDRVRPPRVHITYDVEVGGAIENKELPFVLGVLGDFSGQPDELPPRVKDRKFIEIDRDNFDQVLGAMKPRLAYRVDNKLTDDGSKMGVELRFKNMDDFHPDNVVRQVEPLRKLVDARQRLSDLLSKMDGNDKLEQILNDIVSDTNAQQQLSTALGLDKPESSDQAAPKEESNE
jgi:type VI secretion system protein ImpB